MNKQIPAFGLGTFRLKGQTVIDSVSTALELGYRAIDTAQIYGNEAEVGQAIEDSAVSRDDLFITTKIWIDNFSRDKLLPSLQESLDKLRTEHVDLTLIHWPSPNNATPLAETLAALADAQSRGLTKLIGISNFTVDLMKQSVDILGKGNIATNQVELSPHLQNRKVVDFAHSQGIHITSYMTLGYGKVLEDPVIQEIAAKHQATPAQVALAWAVQLGYSVIPSSTKRTNLESNLKARQLKLSDDDMARIATLERNGRLVNPEGLAPKWD